jgi:hypothetical protein
VVPPNRTGHKGQDVGRMWHYQDCVIELLSEAGATVTQGHIYNWYRSHSQLALDRPVVEQRPPVTGARLALTAAAADNTVI